MEQPGSSRAERLPERFDLSQPANQRKLDVVEQLTALADDALLDRIDAIVPPGTTINPAGNSWANPALEPAARRR